MESFRKLSGDENPLHFDAEFAKQRGFRGPVVYGGLIVARVSGLIGSVMPGPGAVWTGLSLDFRNPLYAGEEAVLTGKISHRSDAAKLMTIDLKVAVADRTVANGSAEVSFR